MNPRTPPQEKPADRSRQTLYVLTADDATRIESMIELVSDALWELLSCRKIELPVPGGDCAAEFEAGESLSRARSTIATERKKRQEF